ncbi:OLC1v1008578C1 [Oldenlandia corymbosa var. corymbosa]|uniref:OLC1v1008578C1 n=1 Tax=Oldenlandia corymbosa var. corymbosa TaxID=529605 RepID=A0AAV1DPF2_OLDCO|nr:OLC1v1008578C1 [Oldenlandia corymbosa var. corymbosa]
MEDFHKALNDKGLTVSSSPEKGRSLLTTRDFSPGEVILSQEPYVSVPNRNSIDSRPKCEWCFSSSNLKKCSACKVVWYCGRSCQTMDWKLHSLECQVLCEVDKSRLTSLTPSIRLMVKLFLRRKLQKEKGILSTSTDNYNLVEALVSHMSDINEEQLVSYAQMANLVNLILQSEPDVNIKEIAVNFSRLACNAHTICDAELRPVGTGLYPVISLINHSCLPNSVLVFDGRVAVVRSLQYIPKGSEVLISYIETAASTMTRQKSLKEQYFFTCTCTRCKEVGQHSDIRESAILEGYRCKDDNCIGFLLRDSENKGFICQQCGLLRDKEEVKSIAAEIKLLTEKVSTLSSEGKKDTRSIYTAIEKLQVKLCHPFSVNLMRTRETLLKTYMEVQDWEQALAYCRIIIPIYERVYPSLHPLIGLQYYTCGKLEWFLGETLEAIQSFTKALGILSITHGTATSFVKELVLKLEEAHAEASHKNLAPVRAT